MPELRVLVVQGEQAQAVRHDGGSHPPPARRAAEALAALSRDGHGGDLAWLDAASAPRLRPAEAWPALRRQPLELLHLGDVAVTSPAVASLGWIDFESPHLLPAHTTGRRASWLVSPRAGLVRGSILTALGFAPRLGLATALADVARRGLAHGVFPIAEPALAAAPPVLSRVPDLGPHAIAQLLRRSLDRRWVVVWLLAAACFGRRLPLIAALRALATRRPPPVDCAHLASLRPAPVHAGAVASPAAAAQTAEVVIPTLGRPQMLEDTLDDLAAQYLPPVRVVVVDQRPQNAGAGADAVHASAPEVHIEPAGERPFVVERLAVTWMGACRARNLGLARTTAPWVLLLDDDVRFGPDLLAGLLTTARAYQVGAINPRIYLPGQDASGPQPPPLPRLWPRFAGVALLSRAACQVAGGFDLRLEGGYGEDFDYGMRLWAKGFFVVYDPGRSVLHLHAPRGGLRMRHPHPWPQKGPGRPRPSPTVMLSRRLHQTPAMAQGFLLFSVLAHLRATPPWRWLPSLPARLRGWRASRDWCTRLARASEASEDREADRDAREETLR